MLLDGLLPSANADLGAQHLERLESHKAENENLTEEEKEKRDPKPALRFEQVLIEALEKAVQAAGVPEELSHVADLQLAFDNAQLLRTLERRTAALKAAKFDKATELEAELTRLKDENLEKFMRPNTFYVTFKYEDTLVRAVEMGAFDFCEEPIALKRAKEPTNIIWENRDVSKRRR